VNLKRELQSWDFAAVRKSLEHFLLFSKITNIVDDLFINAISEQAKTHEGAIALVQMLCIIDCSLNE